MPFFDFPGHLYQAKSLFTNVDVSMYNFEYFTGFYPALYPPLFFTLRDLSMKFLGIDHFVYIFYVLSFFLFWFFIVKIINPIKFNIFLVTLFVFFIFSDRSYLITVSNFFSGSMPGLLGFILLLYFVYLFFRLNRGVFRTSFILGFIGGLIFLTHTITASVYVLFMLCTLLIDIYFFSKTRLVSDFIHIKYTMIALLISLLISLPWLYSFLYLGSGVPNVSSPGFTISEHLIIVALTFFILVILKNKNSITFLRTELILLVFAFVLLFLGMMGESIQAHLNTGMHYYRYYPYGIYFLLIILARIYERYKMREFNFFILIFVAFVFYMAYSMFAKVSPEVSFNVKYPESIRLENNRIFDVSHWFNFWGYPQYIATKVVNETGAIDAYGLFAQDSPLFILISSIKNGINSEVALNIISKGFRNSEHFKEVGLIQDKLELYGISYLIMDKEQLLKLDNELEKQGLVYKFVDYSYGSYESELYLLDTKFDYGVVEPLNYLPSYEPDANFVERWEGLNVSNLYTWDERVKNLEFLPISESETLPKVVNLDIKSDNLKFTLEGSKDFPILVKFADSHVLRVFNNGVEVTKYPVSGDLFWVFGHGDFEIYPKAPDMLHFLVLLSKCTILILSAYLIYNKLKWKKVT